MVLLQFLELSIPSGAPCAQKSRRTQLPGSAWGLFALSLFPGALGAVTLCRDSWLEAGAPAAFQEMGWTKSPALLPKAAFPEHMRRNKTPFCALA